MENLLTFIPENMIILICALYVLGMWLKKLESVKDNYITLFLMAFAIIFAILLNLISGSYASSAESIVNAILQGILCWGVSIGINQTYKQLNKAE